MSTKRKERKMSNYIVTRNGYTTEFFETLDAVKEYIANTLAQHQDLDPKEIFRCSGTDNCMCESH